MKKKKIKGTTIRGKKSIRGIQDLFGENQYTPIRVEGNF